MEAKVDFTQRIAILVDSENLEISVQQNYEPSGSQRKTHLAYPDWMKIIPKVAAGRRIVRNIYYKKKGLKISAKFRRLWEQDLFGEFKQPEKSVDPYLTIDAVTLAEKADSVVILAGDKDYLPLVWYLRSRGCKVEVASFGDAASRVIREAADRFFLLDEEDTIVLEKSKATNMH